MPTLRDGAQVMKGLSMVVDQYLSQQRPGVMTRAGSATYHANELLKIMVEQGKMMASQRAGSTSGTSSHERAAAKGRADVIGFDSISANDSEDFRVPLEKVMAEDSKRKSAMRAKAAPATQVERLVGFGSLFAKMAMGRQRSRCLGPTCPTGMRKCWPRHCVE